MILKKGYFLTMRYEKYVKNKYWLILQKSSLHELKSKILKTKIPPKPGEKTLS